MSQSRHQPLDDYEETSATPSTITTPNPKMNASCRTQDACHPVPMERTDSGYGGSGTTPDSPLSRASSLKTANGGKVRPVRSHRLHSRIYSADSPLLRCTNLADNDVATLPQHTSSQEQTGTTGSYRSSRSSSRRSSFINQSTISNNRRPARPNRSMSNYSKPVEDPILLYQRSKSLWESPENALDFYNPPATLSQEALTTPSLPSLPPSPTIPASDQARKLLVSEEENSPIELHYSNHVPATTIDWTLPSTRRREYRKIESCCRGIPGLWRRFAPGFLQRNRRLTFYNEEKDDEDTGSVRRYRLDLPEDEDEKTKSVAKANTSRLSLVKVKRKWSCMGSSKKFTED